MTRHACGLAAGMRGKRLKSCLWSFVRLSYPNTMLPILRTISVGGVFLAITILGLALIPPGRPHMQFSAAEVPARGALMDQHDHPEWRQFLLLAAVERAEELDRLRGLTDTSESTRNSVRTHRTMCRVEQSLLRSNIELKVAGLPSVSDDTHAEEVTGSVNVAPSATLPIDIGEASSFELPVVPAEEPPTVARSPLVDLPPTDARASIPQGSAALPVDKVSALAIA